MDVAPCVVEAPRRPPVGRSVWIAAGLVAVALAAGLAGLMTRHDTAPQATEAVAAIATRLPRARPDEPLTTGSVNPFTAELPPEPRPADSLAEAARAEDLRSKAFLIASSSAECDEVASSEVLKGGGADGMVVVGIRCANGARFYLDREAILTDYSAPERPARAALTGPEAVRVCEEKLRSGLAVPPSLARLPATTGVNTTAAGDAIVSFDFEAVNGLGFPVFMHARCEIRQREIARLDVQPR